MKDAGWCPDCEATAFIFVQIILASTEYYNPDSHAPLGPRIADFVCPQRTTSGCPEGLSTGNAHPDYTGQRLWTRAGTHVRTPAGPAFIVFAS